MWYGSVILLSFCPTLFSPGFKQMLAPNMSGPDRMQSVDSRKDMPKGTILFSDHVFLIGIHFSERTPEEPNGRHFRN